MKDVNEGQLTQSPESGVPGAEDALRATDRAYFHEKWRKYRDDMERRLKWSIERAKNAYEAEKARCDSHMAFHEAKLSDFAAEEIAHRPGKSKTVKLAGFELSFKKQRDRYYFETKEDEQGFLNWADDNLVERLNPLLEAGIIKMVPKVSAPKLAAAIANGEFNDAAEFLSFDEAGPDKFYVKANDATMIDDYRPMALLRDDAPIAIAAENERKRLESLAENEETSGD